jgi:hypothetical protein
MSNVSPSNISSALKLFIAFYSVKLANNVTYERMIKGLEQLKVNAMAGSSRMTEVLLGKQKPATVEDVPDLTFFDTTLNDSQKEAVRFALGAQDISLIHGPPGVSDLNSYSVDPLTSLSLLLRRAKHIRLLKSFANYLSNKTKRSWCVGLPMSLWITWWSD